ncbi:MAG: TetR/AcrR family transcriptional regulator [Fibromonadaceae bacterium]|jgi:AcrR family transcriptional regulator|nr:TetR/AcrR family transcriptional regulator [Fibromonadaceae bacterium]
MDREKRKKGLILDAMEKLIISGRAADCTVSEIAKTAGIGKGSVYYYYRSKREIEIDLYYRAFHGFVKNCEFILDDTKTNTKEKLMTLFKTYYSQCLDLTFDDYLHLPQNMDMHQKVLAELVKTISPILAKILEQGVEEGILECSMPKEFAEIFVCIFAFLFDPGIFKLSEEETLSKLVAFTEVMEKSLGAEKGFLSFVCDKDFLLSLRAQKGTDDKVTISSRSFCLANA